MAFEACGLEVQNPYTRLVAHTRRRRRLFSVHWELTYRCNQRCAHCYLQVLSPEAPAPELTTAEGLRVLDELAAAGALRLTFSGGEALLRRDFWQLAERAHALRFLWRLLTNGTLITPASAERLAGLHPYAVEISLYGADAAMHERIAGMPGSFERVLDAVRWLRKWDVRTVLKTPLMHQNVQQLPALRALACDLRAHFQYNITITAQDDGGRGPLRYRLTEDDLLELLRQELDITAWPGPTWVPQQRTCSVGLNALALDPYGNVFPCVQLRTSAGNVRERPLLSIWEESPVWQTVAGLTLDRFPTCGACTMQKLCVRCHGLALLEDGDLYGPATASCRQAWARSQVLAERQSGCQPDPARPNGCTTVLQEG